MLTHRTGRKEGANRRKSQLDEWVFNLLAPVSRRECDTDRVQKGMLQPGQQDVGGGSSLKGGLGWGRKKLVFQTLNLEGFGILKTII